MHDLSLGGPVDVGRDPEAKHPGACFDGVYGCHLCWNADNEGKGTLARCDGCHAENVLTLVVRATDEPVLYAACEACQRRRASSAEELDLADFDAQDCEDDR